MAVTRSSLTKYATALELSILQADANSHYAKLDAKLAKLFPKGTRCCTIVRMHVRRHKPFKLSLFYVSKRVVTVVVVGRPRHGSIPTARLGEEDRRCAWLMRKWTRLQRIPTVLKSKP